MGDEDLLDHFAGQALAGYLANPDVLINEDLATHCYDIASWMMSARHDAQKGRK